MSFWDTLSDVTADGTAVGFDAPGGLYDRLFQKIEQSSLLPKSKAGCRTIAGILFAANSLLKQRMGNSPVSNLFNRVWESTARQITRRVLDRNQPHPGNVYQLVDGRTPQPAPTKGRDAFFQVSAEIREKLRQQSEQLETDDQRQLYKNCLGRATAAELASIAEMPIEDLGMFLSFFTKKSFTASTARHATQAVNSLTRFIAPWMGKGRE